MELSPEINQGIESLRKSEKMHLEIAKSMLEAYEGALYPLDLLALSAIHRSMNLLHGFCVLIEQRNLLCAAPLLRLQLDNCLRFYAASIVKNPHVFATAMIGGMPVNRQKDSNGNRMYDSYLVKCLGKTKPWIKKLYEQTSGYVHLSEKHIFNSMKTTNANNREIKMVVALADPLILDKTYIEAIEAFKAVTKLFFDMIQSWIITKDNPEKIKELKTRLITQQGIQ